MLVDSSLVFGKLVHFVSSIGSLVHIVPSGYVVHAVSTEAHKGYGSVVGELRQGAQSTASRCFGVPPEHSVVVVHSTASMNSSSGTFVLFAMNATGLAPIYSGFELTILPPSDGKFVTLEHRQALGPIGKTSKYRGTARGSMQSSIFTSESGVPTSSEGSSAPSNRIASFSSRSLATSEVGPTAITGSSHNVHLSAISFAV